MKRRVHKKQMKRLWKAVEVWGYDYDFDEQGRPWRGDWQEQKHAKKPLSGKSMRWLLHHCSSSIEEHPFFLEGARWLYGETPKFNNQRRYTIYAELGDAFGPGVYTLTIHRQ